MLTLSLTFESSLDTHSLCEVQRGKMGRAENQYEVSLVAVCSIRQKEEKIYKYVPCFTYKLVRFKNCFRS